MSGVNGCEDPLKNKSLEAEKPQPPTTEKPQPPTTVTIFGYLCMEHLKVYISDFPVFPGNCCETSSGLGETEEYLIPEPSK